jgi:hypothetical protein
MSNLSKTTMPDPTRPYRPFTLTLRRVFVGEQGIRAGWSVLIFAAISGSCKPSYCRLSVISSH